MTKILIDTSAFICLTEIGDKRYQKAIELYRAAKKEKAAFFVTSDILVETITRTRYKLGLPQAKKLYKLIKKEEKRGFLEILQTNILMADKVIKIMEKFKNVELSFTDCTSFLIMKQYKLDYIFAFDSDFVKMGLKVLS